MFYGSNGFLIAPFVFFHITKLYYGQVILKNIVNTYIIILLVCVDRYF